MWLFSPLGNTLLFSHAEEKVSYHTGLRRAVWLSFDNKRVREMLQVVT